MILISGKKLFYLVFCVLSVFTYSLNTNANSNLFSTPDVIVDPYKRASLSAIVNFSTTEPAEITIKVYGQKGARDIVHTFKGYKKEHKIPVLGLYAGRKTKVELIAKVASKKRKEKKKLLIKAPKIRWQGLFLQRKKDTNNPVNYFFSDGVVIDENADIRYVFDGKGERVQLSGGEIITESRVKGLKRYSMLGELLQEYHYPSGFTSFTHGISQRPNKNFLVIGSYRDTMALIAGKEQRTQRDFIIEIDYKTGKKINDYDIASLLNPDRTALVQAGSLDYGLDDFCHLNSVDYNSTDDSVICSCRNSGVFKMNLKDKKLEWIITPNLDLNKSGRYGKGPDISSKVLKAIDKNNHILLPSVQKGYEAHSDFKWPTSTHHARFWGDGYVSVFDNSGSVFDQKLVTTKNSIASVYKVDEENGTVKHIFSADQGCYSGPAGSVIFDKENDIVTSFISQCHDETYSNTSWGYIRSYDFKTQNMLSEILVHKAGAAYFYEIWPFNFYQTTGGMLTQ